MSLFQESLLFLASQSFCQKAQIQPTMLSIPSYYFPNMPAYATYRIIIKQTCAYNYELFMIMQFFSTHKSLRITLLDYMLSIINKFYCINK